MKNRQGRDLRFLVMEDMESELAIFRSQVRRTWWNWIAFIYVVGRGWGGLIVIPKQPRLMLGQKVTENWQGGPIAENNIHTAYWIKRGLDSET